MLIDLTCPAEVFSVTMPTEDIPAVSLVMYNLSDRVIVSVEVTLKLMGGSGLEKERVVFRARALNGRPHSTFPMNVPCAPVPGARGAEATVDKVWYNDNAVWRRDSAAAVEYTSNALPVSKALTDLQFVAGEAAVGYPTLQNGLWLCVCGRPNPEAEPYCARCRREKTAVFTRYNREAVEKQIAQREKQLDLATRNVREDTARMQRIREEEYQRKEDRRARRVRLGLCVPLCLILTAFLLGVGAPVMRFLSADLAMAEKNWAGAIKSLRILGNEFPDAERRLAECEWQQAKELADGADTPEKMEAAAAAMRAVANHHPEGAARAEELDLARGYLALAAEDTDAARAAVESLPEADERRVRLENECLFLEAKGQMAAEDYANAREAFLLLQGVFPEAASLAAECVYIPAARLMDEGLYDEAIEQMSRIPEHPQSRAAILKCHYQKGIRAEEDGDPETAAAEFLMASGYEDATERMQAAVFNMGEEKLAAGDTEGAHTLYASLPGYAPAVERERETALQLAKTTLDARDYDRAANLLMSLPEGYGDSAEYLSRAAYLAGSAALRRKEWETAARYLEAAGDYRDGPSLLESALESLTRVRLDEGDVSGAIALLPRITHSKHYKEYKQEAEYLDAVALAAAGASPAMLQKRFESLGNYRDAKTKALEMIYLQAQQAEELRETLTAARLYAKAGTYADAKEKSAALFDAYYGETAAAARDAYNAKDFSLAVTLLETLDRGQLPAKYADLNELYENACVSAGEKLFEAGRPYEAARYFRLSGNDRRVRRWLSSACYRILGDWVDREGNVVASFREDSTCDIAGESFTFLVADSFTLKVGTDGEMTAAFRISNLTDDRLEFRDQREGKEAAYSLYRTAPDGEKAESAENAENGENTENQPAAAGDDYAVEDGE